MKKLLSILTLSLSLLTSSILTTSANPSTIPSSDTSYTMIALATQSTYNPSDSVYHTTLQNENGEAFIVLTTDDVTLIKSSRNTTLYFAYASYLISI